MTEKKFSIITEKDVLILRKLLEDGRASSASISKEIDLGREIVNYRIKRLIKENLIVKFIPKVNEKAVNYQEYTILLKLNLDDEVSKDSFIKNIIGNKYLVWTIKSQSGWDFIVRLYAQSVDEFKNKLEEILEMFSDVLAKYYTIITSDELKESEKELLQREVFHEMPKNDFSVIKEGQMYQIDEKDREILHYLEDNARVQYKEIADKLEISSDTVKYRIDKMKSQGIIEGFEPVINFNKLGFMQYAAILRFTYLEKKEQEQVEKFIKNDSSVVRAINSLNNDEYFFNLVFTSEDKLKEFKIRVCEIASTKIEIFEMFNLD